MIHPAFYIGFSEGKGRGVFTRKAIKAGIVVESSPGIIMSHEDHLVLKQTLLRNYVFEWNPPGKTMMCCLPLGWIGLYNHSYESNCEHTMDYINNIIKIKAIRDIKAGEEITINYNGKWDSKFLVWFDRE